VWASRPNGSDVLIKNVRANSGCPNHGEGQTAGWPRPRLYDIDGATRIYQRVLCVGSASKPYCSARSVNYIRTFRARAVVVDTSPPGVSIVRNTPFTQGAWVHGTQQVNYVALDNVGVRLARPVFAGAARATGRRACNYALPVPCPNGIGAIQLPTEELPEGTQPLRVQAQDAASNWGTSGPVTVRVDHTAPGAVALNLEGGQGWRNVNAFNVAWMNPPEGDRAPIVAARYRLCEEAGATCIADVRAGPVISSLNGLAVPGPGEWQLRLWREDAAANQEPANASVPVALRYDPTPPQLGFEQPDATDPTRVSVRVTDELSGLDAGAIELSRQGSGLWQVLPTTREGEHLVARIDDARLAPGTYELRATARDRATNQGATSWRLDGAPMLLSLPLRTPTVMKAGLVTRRGAHGRRTRSAPIVRARLGRALTLRGRLTRSGAGIPGAQVQILRRTDVSPEHELATVRTGRRGRWVYRTRAGSSAVFRAVHPGTTTALPAQSEARVLVRAASTMQATPRRLLNGQSVRFHGRLRSRPVPPAGKLIELQVVLSGRWQTFRTIRSDSAGAWQSRYRFRRSCGITRYRFRARLPAETGYPFESGRTRARTVRVRGRPCR
jgi:hypothetical protein